jgi:hypothetical protein
MLVQEAMLKDLRPNGTGLINGKGVMPLIKHSDKPGKIGIPAGDLLDRLEITGIRNPIPCNPLAGQYTNLLHDGFAWILS